MSADGLLPGQQLVAINRRAARLIDNQQSVWTSLLTELASENVHVVGPAELSEADRAWCVSFGDAVWESARRLGRTSRNAARWTSPWVRRLCVWHTGHARER